MLPRSRLLPVVAALLVAMLAFTWLHRGDIAAPAASSGPVQPRAGELAMAGSAPEPASDAAVAADRARGREPAREVLAVEQGFLRGMVVDEAGTPIAGATIARVSDIPSIWLSFATTSEDGAFSVDRGAGDQASHIEIRASHEQFDFAQQWLPWGRTDARLVLRARVPIEVRVVDELGAPVPVAHVKGRWAADNVDGSSQHPEFAERGDAWCALACRGKNEIIVELAASEAPFQRLASRFVTVAEPGPVLVRFVAAATKTCEVRVVDPAGAPVAESNVELIDPRGGTVTAHQRTVDPYYAIGPIKVGSAKTDATGTAWPIGPVGRPLVARASCEGFVPGLVTDVRVPGEEPVIVRLGIGANGRGRVLADPHLAEVIAGGACKLILTQEDGWRLWPDASRDKTGIPVGTDGSFVFAGAPPGVWRVTLRSAVEDATAQPGAMMREDCGMSFDLAVGDNPGLVVDLTAWRWTEVRLRILVDGAAACEELVWIRPEAASAFVGTMAKCDAAGHCATWLRPGRYWLDVAGELSAGMFFPESARGLVEVAGARVDRELRLGTGQIAVKLVDKNGEPVRGLRCSTVPTDEIDEVSNWSATDGDGVLRGRLATSEWAVLVRLLDDQSLDHSRDDVLLQMARARRVLGSVTVRAGETATATFVVPDDVPR